MADVQEAKTAAREWTPEEVKVELDKLIGPTGDPQTVPVELLSVTRLAMATDDYDPIHYDARAARRRGYRGIVAPWFILELLQYNIVQKKSVFAFGKANLHGNDEFEYYEPIVVGDQITVHAAIVKTEVKQGRSGLLGFITRERRFVNQFDELCAVWRTIAIRR